MNKTNTNKAKMIEALKQHRGLVLTACKAAGIGRTSHYEWLKNDPEYQKAVSEVLESEVERVESKFLDTIDDGNTSSMQFYLKHKSPDYKNKLQIEGNPDKPITIQPMFGDNLIKPVDNE